MDALNELASDPTSGTGTEFFDEPTDQNIPIPETSTASGAGVDSLNALDSDDGADMDIFDDDDHDDYNRGGSGGGSRNDIFADESDKSPISWSGTGKKKQVSAALRDEIKELLNKPLTIPALIPKKHVEHGSDDEDDDDDKSSESGEDYTDDEDEGESGYKPGGYHPVKVGDIFNQGYVLLVHWRPACSELSIFGENNGGSYLGGVLGNIL